MKNQNTIIRKHRFHKNSKNIKNDFNIIQQPHERRNQEFEI